MTLFGQPKGREIDERTPIRTSRPRNCRRPYTAMLEFGESPPKNPTVMGSKSVLKYGPPHGDLCRQAASRRPRRCSASLTSASPLQLASPLLIVSNSCEKAPPRPRSRTAICSGSRDCRPTTSIMSSISPTVMSN